MDDFKPAHGPGGIFSAGGRQPKLLADGNVLSGKNPRGCSGFLGLIAKAFSNLVKSSGLNVFPQAFLPKNIIVSGQLSLNASRKTFYGLTGGCASTTGTGAAEGLAIAAFPE